MKFSIFQTAFGISLLAGGVAIGFNINMMNRSAPNLVHQAPTNEHARLTMSQHHPVLDCQGFIGQPVTRATDDVAIAGLGPTLENTQVTVRARVIARFPDIMQTNWYHLCDTRNGHALLAETRQSVSAGTEIVIRGTLRLNVEIPGVHRFPLFLQQALIEGQPPPAPYGVTYL